HAFGDIIPTAALSFAGSDFFAIAGVPIAEDAAVIEAGLGLELAPNATLGVAYQGQIAAWREGGLEDQVLTAGGIASENDHAHGAPARHEGLGFSLGPPLTTQLLSSSASCSHRLRLNTGRRWVYELRQVQRGDFDFVRSLPHPNSNNG